MQAQLAGDKEVLKDWCSDMCYNVMASNIDVREQSGHKVQFKVQDIVGTEVHKGFVQEDMGPVSMRAFLGVHGRCVYRQHMRGVGVAKNKTRKKM